MTRNIFETAITTDLATVSKQSFTKAFDCIIVGGGTAGIIFATELAKNKELNILLIENGNLELQTHINNSDIRFNPSIAQSIQTGLEYFPQNAEGGNFGFLISCLGGRSLFWGGSTPRFGAHSFSNWPLTYAELAEAYHAAESAFHVSTTYGNSNITQMFCRLLQANGVHATPGPFALNTVENKNGIIGGTIANALSILFRSNTMNNTPKNLFIATGAFTQNVLISDKNLAKGIVCKDKDNVVYEIFGDHVVLAASAFESTRIALSSDIKENNPIIGKFISEHIFCRAYFGMSLNYYSTVPEAAIILIPGTETNNSQIEIQLPGHRLLSVKDKEDWLPEDVSDNYKVMMRSFGSVESRVSNFIELIDSNIPGGFKVHMEYSDKDNALCERMLNNMQSVKRILSLSDASINQLPKGSSNHEAGGLIMGIDANNSVTDKFGRFHSVPNLISGDAANFPSISCANLHLTIAALAYYKSARLLENMKKR